HPVEIDPSSDASPAADQPANAPAEHDASPHSRPGDSSALSWQATVGGRPDRESGLGAAAALAFRSPLAAAWHLDFDLAASRDPGERGLWDERRGSAALPYPHYVP